ncbi:SusC/RagA family TonB-linked outer membrane protein [Desertivirga arenae]|uniref:SusC/RagA family TonB-linked outer membrane protein n=1 Tax=Desertivirga arenae TaxID=2810309 RepID=UPI001A976F78|nr:TonB-dependent receptor [Pedobacter sp. SYSU D00823]
MKKDNSIKFIPLVCLLLALLSVFGAYAQDTRVITGIVIDDTGLPLPGASVKLKNGTASAQTADNGSFSIRVPQSNAVLQISFVGFQTKEVSVGNNNIVKVTLNPSASNKLNEVVVIGYGAARRAEITSSIASVSEKDIKNTPVAGVDQAIQGKVAGVTISTNGGQPGGGVSVRIGGITSVNGNEPLYVIDGVPIGGAPSTNFTDGGAGAAQTAQSPLANINPADVASIDILKDASAQAIYGSRAANGVVIVTTKKGRAGESKISYDVFAGVSQIQRKLDMMNLSQFAQYENEVLEEIATVNENSYVPIPEYRDPSVLGKGTDWQDALFQRGNTQQHQVSFSGGANKTTYYTSVNYYDQSGVVIGSGLKRYAIRVNLDQQVKDWFKVGLNSTFTRSNQQVSLTNGSATPISVAVSNSPAAPILVGDQFAPAIRIGGYNFGENRNPIALASLRDIRNIQAKALASLYGEVSLSKNFSFRSQLGVDYSVNEGNFFEPQLIYGTTAIIPVSRINLSRGIASFWSITNYLSYNQKFNKHNVSAQLGQEAWESKWDGLSAGRRDLNLNFQSIAAGSAVGQETGGSLSEQAMASYFGRAGYSYDNKYSVNFSIRRDGTSYFGPDNRYGYFPAVSFGWTVTNEKFADNLKLLNYLKFRFGAGAVGRGVTNYANAYTAGLRQQTGAFGPGSWPSNVPNPALKWESVNTYNAAADATLFNKKLELTIDVYRKITTDMLLPSNLPAFTGIGTNWDDIQSPITNAGKIQNTGIDVSATSYNIQRGPFTWRTSFNITHYKNVLKELNAGTSAITYSATDALNADRVVTRTVIGKPVGQFYGYIADGLYRSEQEINSSARNPLIAIGPKGIWMGDVKYRDLSGPNGSPDGKIDSYDITSIGNPNPKFTFGLTNNFTFKSFDLSVFLQGSYGADILNFTKLLTEGSYKVYYNQSVDVLNNRYSVNNPQGSLPRYNQWHGDNLSLSSRFVEDGSYLRIQNVTLGYNLPKTLISKAKISNARVFILGQNLYTFTKYSGLDPELGSYNNNALMSNVDNGNYPNPRTFTIGANITF